MGTETDGGVVAYPTAPLLWAVGGAEVWVQDGDAFLGAGDATSITATLDWVDADGNPAPNPPKRVLVVEGSISRYMDVNGDDTLTDKGADNGLGDPIQDYDNSYGYGYHGSSGTPPNDHGSLPRYNTTLRHYSVQDGSTGTITLPTRSLNCYVAGSRDGTSPGQSEMMAENYYQAIPYNIVLSSPDPKGHPELGDGTNQFKYGVQQPDGYLYVPGAATVVPGFAGVAGGTQEMAQWLLDNNHVDLKVENSSIPHTFAHQWAVSGSTISVNTPNNGYPDYQPNTWVFKGLPDNNSDFGNHEVNLYVDGGKSETAHIQTFFNATARNWAFPGGGYNDGRIPNWWYSYNAIYPQGIGYVFYEDSTSSSNTPVDKPNPHLSYITNDAYNDWNAQLYRIAPIPLLSAGYIQDAGTLQIKGIHNFIWTCAHEATHRQMLDAGIDDPIFHHFGHDSDGDGLSDEWETAHHLDPNRSDTTGTYGGSSVGDTETCANIGAWGVLSGMKDTWKQDWADTGLQWGDWFNYDPDVNSDAKHPYRPWQYESADIPVTITSDPPGDVLGAMP